MKKIIFGFVAILTLASCQQQKIGFVDNGEVINELKEREDIEAKFETKNETFTKKRDSMVQAFQQEVMKAQEDAKRLTQSKTQELFGQLQQKEQMLGQQLQVEQQQLEKEFQIEIDTLIVKVKDFVSDYGETNGYTYILGTSDASASVLYGQEENDLTETIRKALDAEYNK